ncbi:MAG: DNA repair protein RadC [Gemmatimonadaceae bacterium]|nr:DNA repair protein RadC [Gemmatimonadaceae bacterium]
MATLLRLRELPRGERPRERLQDLGPRALATAELLAIVLGAGSRDRSAVVLAHDLLRRADGSLRRLATTPLGILTQVDGVGEARAVAVLAALELARRLAGESREENVPLRSPREVWLHYAPKIEDAPVEEFHVAVLDRKHRLERDLCIARGILDGALVHAREVFRDVIAERASAIVLVHNHPSGDPTPSADDLAVTRQLVAAGRILDIPVQDHVVIGRGRYQSMAELGLL